MTTPTPTMHRLAQQARRLVSFPSEATLEIDGVRQRHTGHCGVGLAEHHGVPTFFCSVDSPLVASADLGLSAILVLRSDAVGSVDTIDAGGASQQPTFVRLVGVLTRSGTELVDGVEVIHIDLDPARISLHADVHDSTGTEVPLEAYRDAACPHRDLPTVARQIIAHANDAHGLDLRGSIARIAHVPSDDVIAAEVTALDADGTVISWVDERGAHRTRLNFASAVECPYALADALRELLDEA